ncbi:oxygenase MpaB family protein [Nocardia asteroides]|uniref:oxygenase MpaB family protein n=1 Tax=Nocardia asteroides TaxID=1824 RepID=UPI0037C508CC
MVGSPRLPALPFSAAALRKKSAAPADDGFFGPDSVCWKVWLYPSSIVIGFVRAVTIEQLDPNLNAAVEQSGGVRGRTRTRYERTMRYFALVIFGDSATTAQAADVLVKIHSKAIGVDPITGGRFDANAPRSQLWIHMTAWHSILYCYEKFGPGPLSPAEEDRYWAECARAAELQTIDPAEVPRNRAQVQEFFAGWRPHLAASENAQSMTDYILDCGFAFPESWPGWTRPARRLFGALYRRAVISTYPQYIRTMFGVRQSRVTGLLITAMFRALFRVLVSNTWLYARATQVLLPTTADVVVPRILRIPPTDPVTMTPREAQARYGYDLPAQAHQDLRRRQETRVFADRADPSDEGLLESEQFIGTMRRRDG